MKPPHQNGRSRSAQSWCDDSEVSARRIEVHQNWLERLFRVKPATRYLCLRVNRRRVQQEVVVLLRDWRKYGICNVEVDKERNIVFAKVGAQNCTLRRCHLNRSNH
jgi:serine/threonine-protein kinase HSL1, negative regulator of Swe1 kinase